MAKFRKKPVVIDAVQWDGTNVSEIRDFFGSFLNWRFIPIDDGIDIVTLGGTHRASKGDWIVKGVQGEFYPVKPDIFAVTYEVSE